MDRMHIKRLLTICLALMLSVSMLPAGTFALTEADAASDQNQTSIEATGKSPDNNGEDKLQTDTASDGVLDNRESDPNEEGNKGSDINQNDDVNQSPDMISDPADDQNNNDSDSSDQDVKKDSVNDPDADSKLTKGDESKGATDSTSLEVTFNDVPLPMQETYSMLANDQVTMVITATMPSTAGEKTITIDIPTGWAIMGCSALDSDELPVIDLSKAAIMDPRLNSIIVGQVKVDPIYIPQLKGLTIDPVTSAGIDSAYGTVTGDTWESQFLEGYDGVSNAHTLGGRLTYTLDDNAQNMQLIVRLLPQPFIFSREGSDTTEVMPPVVTTLSVKKNGSEDAEVKELSSENNVTATNIPRVRGVAQQPVTLNEIIPVDDDRVHMSIQGGISQWNGATQNSTWYSLTDEYTYTITYPPGVFYSEDQTGGQDSQGNLLKQIIPQGSEITVDEDPVNGGGTVTITGTNYTLKHNSTEFRLYFDAKGFNENVDSFHPGCSKVWAQSEDPETLTITANAEFKRLGTTVTTDDLNWKRTIYRPAEGDSYAIKIGETDIVRRDLVDDFGLDRYDIKLAHTSLESSFVYEDVPFHFVNQDNRLGITGFRMVGKDIKDIEIKTFYADGRPGRTIPRIDGPYGTGFPPSDTNGSYMIAGGEIGLNPGEYISEVNLRADIDQKKYGTGNLGCGIGFIGQFLQDRSDEEKAGHVDVAIVHYEDGKYVNTPAKSSVANDPETGEPLDVTGYAAVTVGMDVLGCGSCPTTVSKSQDGVNATDPTWYPNQVVYIKSTLDSSWAIHEQDSLIDPVITIALPEGLVLNNDSVKGQSLAGNHQDDSWFDLKSVGSVRQIEVDGVTWNCYDFTSVNPLDMVASESRTNVGNFGGTVTNDETRMSIRFEAYVASNCHPYSLDVADCVLWYVGDNVKNGNGGSPAISKDVDNRMGRGTDTIAAHGSKKFYIKPLIGLVTDLAIRADESPDADWMTWAGGDNTVANVHEGQPAQVSLSYESTADSVNFNDSVFYLPIPKKDAVYDYLNNAELASPMDVADPRTFGFTASLTGPVTMQGGETKWTTYYAVSAKSADTVYDSTAPDSDKWEPVSPVDPDTWLTEGEITDWSDVVMVKFHADDPIPPGEKGQALFTMDIDPDAEFGTYDYWRSYGKARLGDSKDQWMYTPVIAATPTSATLLGQLFIDDDMNTAFDEDSEQGYGTNFTAVLTKDDASTAPMDVTVDTDGSMKLLDTEGRQIYLRQGDYTLTVTKSDDETVYDYEKVESDTKSSAEKWYNDIKNANISDAVATHQFTVDKSVEKTRSRAEGNIKPVVYYAGVGLAKMNDFTFTKLGEIEGSDGSATNEPLAGAKFALYTDADCKTPAERDGTAYEATSDAEGKVEFNGIVAGTYYMKETALPSGTEDTYFANTTTYKVVVDNEEPVKITRTIADPNTGDTVTDADKKISIINRQKTSVTGIKIWRHDSTDGPTPITVNIITEGATAASKTVEVIFEGEPGDDQVLATETADGWTFTVDGLNRFKDGAAVTYKIAEEALDGYLTYLEGNTITNIKKTEATVRKEWNDGGNTGKRPSGLKFSLYQSVNGGRETEVKDSDNNDVTVTLPVSSKWEATVTDLPKYDYDGNEITYSWKEPETIENYRQTDKTVNGTVTTFTNTLLAEVVVEKEWNTPESKTNPDSVTVHLSANGNEIDSAELSEDNKWKHTFTSTADEPLYAYDEDGQEIEYKITEDEVANYSSVIAPESAVITEENEGILQIKVTNTYSAEGTLDLGGLKKLDVESGKLVAEQFKFTVTDNGEEIATGTNAADGTITFTPASITYKYDKDTNDTGKHTIVISETGAVGNGAKADAEDVTIEVNVEDANDGTLSVDPADITELVEMTNSYEATGDITFRGKKSIAHGRRIEDGEVFTFTVKEGDETVATGKSDADGNITFTKIEYTLNKDTHDTGTHTYTVTEDKYEKKKGVTNSEQSYEVTVDVKDKGNGELDVTPSENYEALDFENPYEAEGDISVDLTKVLENRAFKDGDEWTFSIEAEDGAPLPVDEEGNEVSEVTLKPTEGNEAKISLGTFKYDLSDLGDKAYESKTFTYTITESGEVKGVKNDADTDRELKIKVTDDGSGELKVELADDSEEVKFTNTYETAGEITFSGKKTLNGDTLKAGQFSFELYDKDGELLETVTNKADGSYSFKTLKFTGDDLDKDADGNYVDTAKTYKVVEKKGTDPQITYDRKEYKITVTLKDDGQGSIKATSDPDEGSLDFTNTYTKNADCRILIKKVNTKGKAISGAVFEVYRVEGGSEVRLTQSDYRWLDANGRFTVGTEPYQLSGLEDGTYEIREVKAPEGYKIKDEWPVTFTVKDGKIDGSLNTLTSGAKYEKVGTDSHLYTITNDSIPGKGVKTGDDTNIGLWLALLLLTAGCLAGTLVYRRRKND